MHSGTRLGSDEAEAGRAITDCAAEAIREAWTAIQDVHNFPDDEAGWIVERGALRNAVVEACAQLGAVLMQPSPSDGAIKRAVELVRAALKTNP
jgi:hypothetical protein